MQAEPDSPDKAEAITRLEEQLAAAREIEAEGPMDLEAANFEPGFADGGDSSTSSGPGASPAGKPPPFGKPAEGGEDGDTDEAGDTGTGGEPFKGKKAPPFGKKN